MRQPLGALLFSLTGAGTSRSSAPPSSTRTPTATATATPTVTSTSTATPTATATATPGGPRRLVGETGLGSSIDSNAGGVAEAFTDAAAGSGPVGTLSIDRDAPTTASQVVVGLYASDPATDSPSLLLTRATISAPVRGARNTVALPAASVSAGGEYWLAVLGRGGPVQFRDAVGGGSSQTHAQTGLGLLPSTWVTGARFSNAPLSADVRSP